ncbi:36456_t:CDS:1, partial [Gigaspora margarita]
MAQSDILFFELVKKTEQELKEKLYFALRSKAEINDLSEKLLTKYLEQEKELLQLRRLKKILVNKPRPYSKVRLCKEAD